MNIRILLILISLLVGYDSYAQGTTQKTQERDVKISGNYYYGDGISESEKDATQLALDDLKLMISEDLKEKNQEVSDVDFNGFEQSIGTITIPVQNRIRIIAFILKKEIKVEANGTKRLMVIRIMPDGTVADANSQTEQPKQVKTTTNTTATLRSATNVNSPIISQLTRLTESIDVGVMLNDNKSKGNLMYGRLSTMGDATKCYFVILKDKKLVDVLDQGSGTTRKGLISGSNVDYSQVKDVIYWVYIN